jgi:hypothetical protein
MIPQILGRKGKNSSLKSRQFHHRHSVLRRPRHQFSVAASTVSRWLLYSIVALGAGLFLYARKDSIIQFLQGPRVPSTPPQWQAEDPRPEDPRPISETIFTAQTRKERKAIKAMRESFHQRKNNQQLQSCRLDGDCATAAGGAASFFRKKANHKILLYNPLHLSRYVCGKEILGNGGTLELDEFPMDCQSSVPYIFTPRPPTISGKGEIAMKPIELYWNYIGPYMYEDAQDEQDGLETEAFPCSIPCRKAGDYQLMSVISVKDTRWELFTTMEGEQYYSQAKVRPKAYRKDQYYAVTSFQSEIPMPYFSWAEYHIQHQAVDFHKVIKGGSFLANNCDSMSDRETLVEALLKEHHLRIDSLSFCHHNAEPPRGVKMENKTAILERYLFHFAFENQRSDDYITEKLWGTLASGTLPVYFGAPNIKLHVPAHSVIFVDDYETPQDLANYLIRLTKDKALYESYHAWRYQPIDPVFQNKYEFTKTHSTCRICKWAYAKRHGFEWNHTQQEVMEPYVARKTCRNKRGLIGHPFKEYWLSEATGEAVSVQSNEKTKTCTLADSNRLLQIDGGIFQRKVYDQDGVTDMIIDGNGNDKDHYILKLETPIETNDLQNIDDRTWWWLQDGRSRMTILTSKQVSMSIVKQGTVEIPISSDLRVRVIVENVDTFHKGARKRANDFGDLMKQDFLSPLEGYKVVV